MNLPALIAGITCSVGLGLLIGSNHIGIALGALVMLAVGGFVVMRLHDAEVL